MIQTKDIFAIADLCAEAGYFPGLEDLSYILVLRSAGSECWTIRRKQVSCKLPRSFRVWLVKGKVQHLLGESDFLPGDLSAGVSPPYI